MPTGQTPTPQVKRGEELAYGDATQANRLASAIPTLDVADEATFEPGGSEEDEFLYGRTDRPMEPVTQGAPFGPGQNVTRNTLGEDDGQFMGRVIAEMEARNPSPQVRKFTERAKMGL